MTTEVELQMHHLTSHYNPNETHPALEALRYILTNVKDAIKGSQALPKYMEEGLISIPLSNEQKIAMDAQVRTLRMVEKMIVEQYPGALNGG